MLIKRKGNRMCRELDEHRLRNDIEGYIEQRDGTCTGESVKNMYENGTSLEGICDYLEWDYQEYLY